MACKRTQDDPTPGHRPRLRTARGTRGLALAGFLLAAAGSADSTFEVDSFADQVDSDLVDVLCQTAAGTCTLRAAVMQANVNPGDAFIHLPAGLFQLTRLPTGANDADSGDLNLTKSTAQGSIHIFGAGATSTIVDGGDLDRIFRVKDGTTARIEDLTVRNGNASHGGGILVEGRITLVGVRVTENLAGYGGGVYLHTGAPVSLRFTDIVANEASSSGGGLYLSAIVDDDVYFFDGEIRDNIAFNGGGLYSLSPGSLTLLRTTVSGNEARITGGLYFAEGAAEIYIVSSTIDTNRATDEDWGIGGGIRNSAELYILSSTISGNAAALDGGGISNHGNATLYNSTVAFNEADFDADPNGGRGGGAYSGSAGVFAIRNSVFAGNTRAGAPVPDDCYGNVGSYGHNRFSTYDGCTITQTGACGGSFQLLASTAELGPLQFNGGATRTHAIQPGSSLVDDVDPPCICQNDLGNPIPFDQREGPRVVGPRCDVGAYELGALPAGSLFADGFESGGSSLWN